MASGKYNDGVEYPQISQVPVGFILPAPQIRDDTYPNRAQGFGVGSKRPMTGMPAVEPVLNVRDNHGQYLSTSNYGRLAQSYSRIACTKTGNRSSDTRNSVGILQSDVIVISDTPSPDSTTTPMENLNPRDHGHHLSLPVMSPEDEYEVERSSSAMIPPVHSRDAARHYNFLVDSGTPIDIHSTERGVKSAEPNKIRREFLDPQSGKKGCNSTGGKKQKRATNIYGKKVSATGNDLNIPKRTISIRTNDNEGDVKIKSIEKYKETSFSSFNVKQDDKTDHFQKVNAKRPEPVNEADITVSESHNKRTKINNIPTTPPSNYASPYRNFLKQYRSSNRNSSTNFGVIQTPAEDKVVEKRAVCGGHIGENIGSEKSVGEKALDGSIITGKLIDQMSTNEEPVSAKSVIEETVSEDSAGGKLIAKAPIIEDTIGEETSRNKLASDKPTENRPLPAKTNNSKSLYRPFSMR